MMKVMNGLAAAYRGDATSKWLPEPCLRTGLWPTDLAQYLPANNGDSSVSLTPGHDVQVLL